MIFEYLATGCYLAVLRKYDRLVALVLCLEVFVTLCPTDCGAGVRCKPSGAP